MKFVIFSILVSFAFLANGAVLPNKQNVTTQEINKLMSDLVKYQIDEYEAKQPLEANFAVVPIKTKNIDVQVEFKDGKQVLGKLTSQSQSNRLTESKVSAGFQLTFAGLVYTGSAQIKGTINKKPVDVTGKITMQAQDLLLELKVEAKHDPKSVEIVDLTFPVTINYNPVITISNVQIEETKKLEKAIEDGLKKQLNEAQKAVEDGKPESIAYLNKLLKGKTLRDLIDMLSSKIPSKQIKNFLGF